MIHRLAFPLLAAALAAPLPARAHHGVAAVGLAGPEGPGAALETTSALPLPQGRVFAMLKSELVPFRRFASAEPLNKTTSSFTTLGAGYGVTPWLSVFAFQPFAVKSQDVVGTNAGLGDPNVMIALGFKLDEGLRLVPEKESLDELLDWHFGIWVASTIPLGGTGARDDVGDAFAPDMQTGFGAPSPSAGVAVLKQLSEDVTALAEASHQRFFEHRYDDAERTAYRFGAESRLNLAVVWRAFASGRTRLDLSGELNGLHLARDRAGASGDPVEPLRASGGDILYAGAGARLSLGSVSAALGIRRAAARSLNEGPEQQGSEGLEAFRASLTLSWSGGGR